MRQEKTMLIGKLAWLEIIAFPILAENKKESQKGVGKFRAHGLRRFSFIAWRMLAHSNW
jgi:hypothetical protein